MKGDVRITRHMVGEILGYLRILALDKDWEDDEKLQAAIMSLKGKDA